MAVSIVAMILGAIALGFGIWGLMRDRRRRLEGPRGPAGALPPPKEDR